MIRWAKNGSELQQIATADPRIIKWQEYAPKCCHLLPILHRGPFDDLPIQEILQNLKDKGSIASPGFMKPEGIVIFHISGNVGFKKTIEKDEVPKTKQS